MTDGTRDPGLSPLLVGLNLRVKLQPSLGDERAEPAPNLAGDRRVQLAGG